MLTVLSDNFYDHTDKLIDHTLNSTFNNFKLKKNHTSNNIRSLKYVYIKSKILKTLQTKIENDNKTLYKTEFELNESINQDDFVEFINKIPPNYYCLFNEEQKKVEYYLNEDHFIQEDYDYGKIIELYNKNGKKIIINDFPEMIDITDNRIIPYKICQRYGYEKYFNNSPEYQCELDPEGSQLLSKNGIYSNELTDTYSDSFYGMIKNLIKDKKDNFFICNKKEKWQKITIIPNNYGIVLGFDYYERLINENKWHLSILISSFESLDLLNFQIKSVF